MSAQKPSWSLLDRKHPYTNAANTDIRKTFARVRRELAAAKPAPKVAQGKRVTAK